MQVENYTRGSFANFDSGSFDRGSFSNFHSETHRIETVVKCIKAPRGTVVAEVQNVFRPGPAVHNVIIRCLPLACIHISTTAELFAPAKITLSLALHSFFVSTPNPPNSMLNLNLASYNVVRNHHEPPNPQVCR